MTMAIQKITQEQTSVLLWVKALNDFTDENNPEDSLDTKINKFSVDSAGLEESTFEEGIEDLCDMGILRKCGEYEEIELTAQGKAVLTALSTIKDFSDETIHKILVGTISLTDFAKKHGAEIITIVTAILSILGKS